MIASRQIGSRRVCSCSFHSRPCREDGRGRVNSGAPFAPVFPTLSSPFRSYRIIGAASGPSTNRGRRGGRADDSWVTSLVGRRRSLIAEREGRGAAPVISTAEDISSRDCRGERAPAYATAPTEMRRADWRSRPRPVRRTCRPRGGIWRRRQIARARKAGKARFVVNFISRGYSSPSSNRGKSCSRARNLNTRESIAICNSRGESSEKYLR